MLKDFQFPQFYVVGAQKCGTTTLYALLRQHPELCLPDLKESHYFALPDADHTYNDSAAERMNRTAIRTENDYLGLFQPSPSQICGEVCPTYLYSDVAAQRIAAVRPDAKIVILLREPVARSFSAYRHMQSRGAETATTFTAALANEDQHRRDGWQTMSHYALASQYAPQVERYYNAFPSDQILVMSFETFTKDPIVATNHILEFLGVSALPAEAAMQQTNKTQVVRNKLVADALIHQRFGVQYLRRILPKSVRGRVKEKLLGLFVSAPEKISDDQHEKLQARFASDVEELEVLTKKTFAEWGHNGRSN